MVGSPDHRPHVGSLLVFLIAGALGVPSAALAQQTAAPPASAATSKEFAEYERGKLFLVKGEAARVQQYLAMFPNEQRLQAVEYLRQKGELKWHGADGALHTLVYAYSGAVAETIKVKARVHMMVRDGGPPVFYEYPVSGATSAANPIVILNETHVQTRSGGMIDVRLFVDDKEVARTRFDVR